MIIRLDDQNVSDYLGDDTDFFQSVKPSDWAKGVVRTVTKLYTHAGATFRENLQENDRLCEILDWDGDRDGLYLHALPPRRVTPLMTWGLVALCGDARIPATQGIIVRADGAWTYPLQGAPQSLTGKRVRDLLTTVPAQELALDFSWLGTKGEYFIDPLECERDFAMRLNNPESRSYWHALGKAAIRKRYAPKDIPAEHLGKELAQELGLHEPLEALVLAHTLAPPPEDKYGVAPAPGFGDTSSVSNYVECLYEYFVPDSYDSRQLDSFAERFEALTAQGVRDAAKHAVALLTQSRKTK